MAFAEMDDTRQADRNTRRAGRPVGFPVDLRLLPLGSRVRFVP